MVRQLSSDLGSWRAAVNTADDQEIGQALRNVETLSRAMYSVMLEVVGEIESRGIAADGGPTSVGNCCLLCPMHHQQVHLQGWDITITAAESNSGHPPSSTPTEDP